MPPLQHTPPPIRYWSVSVQNALMYAPAPFSWSVLLVPVSCDVVILGALLTDDLLPPEFDFVTNNRKQLSQ